MAALFRDTPFNQDISTWDVSNVTNMDGVFDGTNALSNANKGIIHSSFSSNSNWPYDWSSFVVDNTPTVASLLEIAAQGGSGATAKTVSSDEPFDPDASEIFYFTSFTVESGQTLRARHEPLGDWCRHD